MEIEAIGGWNNSAWRWQNTMLISALCACAQMKEQKSELKISQSDTHS